MKHVRVSSIYATDCGVVEGLVMGRAFSILNFVAVAIAAVGLAAAAHAQCTERWQPFDPSTSGFEGTIGPVQCATLWDPDGSGPAHELYVFGGGFTIAGNALVKRVAAFDPVLRRWIAMGSNITGSVHDLKATPDGELYAVTTNPVQAFRWNGSDWSVQGPALANASYLYAVETTSSGQLIVGGKFGTTSTPQNIAVLNGGTWTALGDVGMDIYDLKVRSSGSIVATGRAGTSHPIGYVKEWDGSNWTVIGAGSWVDDVDGAIKSVEELPNGDLLVTGRFYSLNATVCQNAATWDGQLWHPMPIDTTQFRGVADAAVTANGDIYAAFSQPNDQVQMPLMRWTGDEWTPDGDLFTGMTYQIVSVGDDAILAVGRISEASGRRVANIVLKQGSEWNPLSETLVGEFPSKMSSALRLQDGSLLFAGRNDPATGIPTQFVWRYQDGNWTALSPSPSSAINTLYQAANGAVFAGGVGGVYQRFDSSWTRAGNSIPGEVNAIAFLSDGTLAVGGSFSFTNAGGQLVRNIATWNGTDWIPLADGFDAAVNALALLPDGTLVAGGSFATSGAQSLPFIAKWDGLQWSGMGNGMNGDVRAMHVRANGDLIVTGHFAIAGSVYSVSTARWTNGAWVSMPGLLEGATIYAIAERDNGEMVICGDFQFQPAQAARWVARWNGSSWQPLGLTQLQGSTSLSMPYAIADDGEGGVALAGKFDIINALVAPRIARLSARAFVRDDPQSASVSVNQMVEVRARPGAGFSGVSVQWLHNGAPIANGPAGSSPGGGIVTGASSAMPSPTNDADAVLRIDNAQISDSGEYAAVFTSACGESSSRTATVLVVPIHAGCPTCFADFDRSGGIDGDDISAFFVDYERGLDCADVNLDGGVDPNDLAAFFEAYEAGGC